MAEGGEELFGNLGANFVHHICIFSHSCHIVIFWKERNHKIHSGSSIFNSLSHVPSFSSSSTASLRSIISMDPLPAVSSLTISSSGLYRDARKGEPRLCGNKLKKLRFAACRR